MSCLLCASRNASTSRSVIVVPSMGSRRSVSTVFSRREKRKLRNEYPRPDLDPIALFPQLPAVFENKITQADGSSFYLASASPRSTLTLVRDVTNHPLWNPSLTREAAEFDSSGRGGRFARRYAKLEENVVAAAQAPEAPAGAKEAAVDVKKKEETNVAAERKPQAVPSGFALEDLDWMSGETLQSASGTSGVTNIRGAKKAAAKGSGGKGGKR